MGIPAVVGLAGDARAFLERDGAAWLVGPLEDIDPTGLDHALGQLDLAGQEQVPLPFDAVT